MVFLEVKSHCKAKTEEYDRSDLCFSEDFRMFIPCPATYFLETGACLSLKLATKASFRGKKTMNIF